MIADPTEGINIVGIGSSGLGGVLALALALFLKQKFMDSKDKKSGRDSSTMERPMSEWLGSFLEAMTEDRREMKDLFKELTSELRAMGMQNARMQGLLENSANTMQRVEQKTDTLLQRRVG